MILFFLIFYFILFLRQRVLKRFKKCLSLTNCKNMTSHVLCRESARILLFGQQTFSMVLFVALQIVLKMKMAFYFISKFFI